MKDNRLEFAIKDADEMHALGALIASLNREGIPYSLRKDSIAIQLTIHAGF